MIFTTRLVRDMYRDWLKDRQMLLGNSQAGPGRTVKQEQEEISRNHVQTFIPGSVDKNIRRSYPHSHESEV